ncbi:protein kinase family protein [Legionella spiritensis]|uniref:Protein kinase domain protein n=1 Tax=Legionella spiritensis TaxID=452 RepID=A0A0W0Z4P5_LEGSP|nr:hypothetical protein [Legionella spiritensis]KTD64107.1 Protein kinase domain protein [Legionella spiritensis]SNV37851.1 Protein kinase domain [Legionella spiritensis]
MGMSHLPSQGRFFSPKRKQIKHINHLLDKINSNITGEQDIEAVRKYYLKLCDYYWKLMSKGTASNAVREWFKENPLYAVEQWIAREIPRRTFQAKLLPITSRTNLLKDLYKEYEGKSSFGNKFTDMLNTYALDNPEREPKYQDEDLSGSNNPVVKITRTDEHFICRLFRVNSSEDEMAISARIARERLTRVDYVVQPYELFFLEDDGHEKVYMEFTEYFERGSIEAFFKNLHGKLNNDAGMDIEDIQNMSLFYYKELLEFYRKINQHNVWYTDLKPSNVLLSKEGALRISDAKGLLLSSEKMVPICQTNTTQEYHQTSAYHKNLLNLEILQRQNLACTLYQMLTNEIPEQVFDEESIARCWTTDFNFEHPCFTGSKGEELRTIIEELYNPDIRPFAEYLQTFQEKFADIVADLKADMEDVFGEENASEVSSRMKI